MTGTPDAVVEAAAEAIWLSRPRLADWSDVEDSIKSSYRGFARAALAAAEGPWREHLATQIMDELREFLPEWGYPPHVVAAICLELKERLSGGGDQSEQVDHQRNRAESEEHILDDSVVRTHEPDDTPT